MQQSPGVLDMDDKLRNIVVIGGTGNFGARICRRLVNEAGIRLYIAGRSQAPIDQLVSELNRAPSL
jgi:NAD(P)-dependent dehydrogenase (short-subunit alcohol dehydrogenase family)